MVAFTAAQIPDIQGREYPPELSGKLYPEDDLPRLIKRLDVDERVFSYGDVSYHHVMSVGAIVNAAGANSMMLGLKHTQIKSAKPVISVRAVRTGCGKSRTSHRVIEILADFGKRYNLFWIPGPREGSVSS